jgi:membrane-associated phospholipid phosphatase
MEEVHQWGLALIRFIQGGENPALTWFMELVTFLGSPPYYLFLLPLIFFVFNEKRGIRLAIAVIFSAWLNLVLKALLQGPRPYELDPSLGRAFESTYGIPSGHAQNALVLWVILASWGRGKRRYAAAALIIILISFSRLYLGVHFPTDIFAGWLLGALILALYFAVRPRIEPLLEAGGLRTRLITLSLAALLMNALFPEDISMGALLLGIGGGYSLRIKHLASAPPESGSKRAFVLLLRFLLGFTVLALIFALFRRIMPEKSLPSYRLFNFFRYGLLGLWVTLGAPWLFLKLRLNPQAASPAGS